MESNGRKAWVVTFEDVPGIKDKKITSAYKEPVFENDHHEEGRFYTLDELAEIKATHAAELVAARGEGAANALEGVNSDIADTLDKHGTITLENVGNILLENMTPNTTTYTETVRKKEAKRISSEFYDATGVLMCHAMVSLKDAGAHIKAIRKEARAKVLEEVESLKCIIEDLTEWMHKVEVACGLEAGSSDALAILNKVVALQDGMERMMRCFGGDGICEECREIGRKLLTGGTTTYTETRKAERAKVLEEAATLSCNRINDSSCEDCHNRGDCIALQIYGLIAQDKE